MALDYKNEVDDVVEEILKSVTIEDIRNSNANLIDGLVEMTPAALEFPGATLEINATFETIMGFELEHLLTNKNKLEVCRQLQTLI